MGQTLLQSQLSNYYPRFVSDNLARLLSFLWLSLLCLLLMSRTAGGQTINTTLGSTGYTGANNSGAGSFITFVIENNTASPIMLTDVGNWTTTAHNNTTSTLWYSTTNLSGPIPGNALPAAGWINIISATVNGITATGVNPVITNINFIIPAGAIWRFALHTTGTNYYSGTGVGTASPNSFTTAGITLRTGDYQIGGQYVGYGFSNNPRFFTGFVTFMPAVPCSGIPTAGTAAVAGSCPTAVQLSGFTLALNTSIQWQSSPVCGGSWTDIPGATSFRYAPSAISQPTMFRAIITCTNSGQSDTSNTITLSAVMPCYCASGATSASFEDITDVTVGNMSNSSNCSGTYTDFTGVPPPNLLTDANIPFSITVSNCGATNNAIGTAIFIDYNKDGTFASTERVYGTPTTSSGAHVVTGSFTIPGTALTGLTTMRVIAANGGAGSGFTGCQSFTYGETEDYLVNILYAPNVSGAGSGVFCSGENVNLTATAPGITNPQFLWRTSAGNYVTGSILTIGNIQSSQGGNYYVYVLTQNCPGDPPDTSGARIVNLTVNPTPAKPIVAPVIVYCQYEPFDSIPIFGENLKWYSVPTGGTAGPGPQVNTSVPSTVTYYVSQTVDGCESARASVTISVAPKPQPPQAVSPVGYCQGEQALPLVATGQNLRWYSVPAGGVGTPIAPTPVTTAQGSFTWYVTQTVAGCESVRKPVVVNVSYVPNGLITLSRPFVCQYDTITLGYFGNALPDADYIWTLPAGAQIISGNGQGPLVVRFDSAGLQTVKLNVDNGGCKGPQNLVEVPVHLSPKLTIDMPAGVCQDELINLVVSWSTPGIDSFAWDFNGAEVVHGSMPRGPFGLSWKTPGNKTVTVIATDNSCRSLPASDEIDVHELPDASILVSSNNVCAGDSILFSAVREDGASYRWQPHQYFGGANSPEVWGTIDFKRFVKLDVTNRFNCKSSDSIWVETKSCCQIYLPSAFSPNGDGKNDRFRMLTVGKNQNTGTTAHQISIFRIANRWGQTVFETADERTGWDGTWNGQPQDVGTYHYYIKYKCSDGQFYEEKGEMTLVR